MKLETVLSYFTSSVSDAAFSRFHLTPCANVWMSKVNARMVWNVEYAAAGCVDTRRDECWSCWHIDSVMSAHGAPPPPTGQWPFLCTSQQWVHSGPRECLPPHNVSWMSNQSCSIITDNLLAQKPFDFRHLREVCKLSVSSDNDCRPLCCPIVQHCVHTWLRALLSTHHQLVLNTWAVQTCGPKSSRGFKNDFTEWNSNKLDINRVQKYVIIGY